MCLTPQHSMIVKYIYLSLCGKCHKITIKDIFIHMHKHTYIQIIIILIITMTRVIVHIYHSCCQQDFINFTCDAFGFEGGSNEFKRTDGTRILKYSFLTFCNALSQWDLFSLSVLLRNVVKGYIFKEQWSGFLWIVQVWNIISQHQIIVQTWNFFCLKGTLVRIIENFFKFFHNYKLAEKV